MKTFCQFQEDIDSLRRQLQSIEKQDAPIERLKARRYAANQRSKTTASEFQQRMLDSQARAREKHEQMRRDYEERRKQSQQTNEELQTEQTPVMKPNLNPQQVAMRQAAQKTAQIRHVHGELGAEARTQVAAKNRRLKAIMSR